MFGRGIHWLRGECRCCGRDVGGQLGELVLQLVNGVVEGDGPSLRGVHIREEGAEDIAVLRVVTGNHVLTAGQAGVDLLRGAAAHLDGARKQLAQASDHRLELAIELVLYDEALAQPRHLGHEFSCTVARRIGGWPGHRGIDRREV